MRDAEWPLSNRSLTAKEHWSSDRGFLHNRQKQRSCISVMWSVNLLLSQGHFRACMWLCFAFPEGWMKKWAEPPRGAPSSQYNRSWRWGSCVVRQWHHHLAPKKSRHASVHEQPFATYGHPLLYVGCAHTRAGKNRVRKAGFAQREAGSISGFGRNEWVDYKPPSFIIEYSNMAPPSHVSRGQRIA